MLAKVLLCDPLNLLPQQSGRQCLIPGIIPIVALHDKRGCGLDKAVRTAAIPLFSATAATSPYVLIVFL